MSYQSDNLITPGNKKLLTWICYLSYFFTGTLIANLGNLMVPVSQTFGIPVPDMGYIFTYSNFGMWIMIFLAGLLMRRFTIKNLLIISSFIVIIMAAVLNFYTLPATFKIVMFLVGSIGGMFMAISSFMIVQLYQKPKERGTQVLFTDAFFSLALFTIPMIFGELFKRNVFWMTFFFFVAVLGLIMIFLTMIAKFDIFKDVIISKNNTSETLQVNEKWGLSIYLAAAAAFTFILSELIWIVYITPYYITVLHWNPAQAAIPQSLEGLGQVIALFLSPIYAKHFKLHKLIIWCSILSIIFLTISISTTSFMIACSAMFILGLFNATVYAGILAFGTLQVKKTPPFLMTTLLFCGTTGTMLSTPVGSFIANASGLHAVLIWSVIIYVICLICMFGASKVNRMYQLHGEHTQMH